MLFRSLVDVHQALGHGPEYITIVQRISAALLEPDEIDALAVLGQEAAHRLVGIGRLQQFDVADARGQDRVLESERRGLAAPVDAQAGQRPLLPQTRPGARATVAFAPSPRVV